MSTKTLQALKKFVLFSDLTPAQMERVAAISQDRRFRMGATIFIEGDKSTYVVLITSGIVKISRSAADGRVKTLALLKTTDFFGEMAIFLPGHKRSATAEALTECKVITIEQDEFERLLKEVPAISIKIIQTLAQRLQAADRQIKMLALGDSRMKLADLLLSLGEEFPEHGKGSVLIPLTHQDLADLAGLSRETTTRLLNSFSSEDILTLKARQVLLKKPDLLKKYAN